MKVTASMFEQVSGIFLSSKKRRDAEYADFLAFFRNLVEQTDGPVSAAVGRIEVTGITPGGTEKNYGIILTAADYMYWKEAFAEGIRFKRSIEQVKTTILLALAKKAEGNNLTADERKQLLALLDQSPSGV